MLDLRTPPSKQSRASADVDGECDAKPKKKKRAFRKRSGSDLSDFPAAQASPSSLGASDAGLKEAAGDDGQAAEVDAGLKQAEVDAGLLEAEVDAGLKEAEVDDDDDDEADLEKAKTKDQDAQRISNKRKKNKKKKQHQNVASHMDVDEQQKPKKVEKTKKVKKKLGSRIEGLDQECMLFIMSMNSMNMWMNEGSSNMQIMVAQSKHVAGWRGSRRSSCLK